MKAIVKRQNNISLALFIGLLLYCTIGAVVNYDPDTIKVVGWFGVMTGAVIGRAASLK